MEKNRFEQLIKDYDVALEWAALCFIALEVIGMFYTPTVGAIGILLGAVFVPALFIGILKHILIQSNIAFWKVFVLKYVIGVSCALVVWWLWWDKLVAIFPSNSQENVFVSQTETDNTSFPSWLDKPKYELLVEFGARYHDEATIDLEINVGNVWTKQMEGWWDKPHLTEKSSSSISFDKPVTLNALANSINTQAYPQNIVQDFNNMPVYKLKFDAIPIVPGERSLYLRFQSDKPLSLKSSKFKGKSL